jgi:hypothetical protein
VVVAEGDRRGAEQVVPGARLTMVFERADEESEAMPVFRLA